MSNRNNGYIRLYRNIMDWGWYREPNTVRLFIHCLLKANYTEKEWQGIKIPIGSFVTSYANLAQELKLSIQNIKTAIKHLKLTNELTIKSTGQYSIITVKNYSYYQTNNTRTNLQLTNDQPTANRQLTTTNKRNKGKKEEYYSTKEIFKELKERYEREGHL